ncbi:MAG TPA: glycosyltransferase [Bacillota bacterium]|nr:glycosyltransferase [Bacillota bacterium]
MSRILFSVGINAVEALGSVTRMVAIAKEVRKLDPETVILFRADGVEAEHVRNHGFQTVPGYKPNIMGFSDLFIKFISALQGEWNGKVGDLKRMDDVIRLKGIFTKKFVAITYHEWVRLIDEFKPDVLVSEFDLIAPIVARVKGIPHYLTCGTPGRPDFYSELFYKKPHPDRGLSRHYNKLLRRLGLPEVDNAMEVFLGTGYSRRIVPSIPALEDLPQDEMTHFMGGIIPENFSKSSWNWEKKRPLIYVYMSIGQISAELAERVLIDTFAESEYDVIFAGAGHPYFEKKDEYTVGNVHFRRYVPADQVMKQADIVIHHGGQNTTLQCIEACVPAIIFPGRHFERYYNAKKAAEAGCAYCLKNEDFNKETLLRYCQELLEKHPFDAALKRQSAISKGLGGSRGAAELILGPRDQRAAK